MDSLDSLDTKALLAVIKSAGLSSEGCIEREDLVSRAREARERLDATSNRPPLAAGTEELEAQMMGQPSKDAPEKTFQASMFKQCLDVRSRAARERAVGVLDGG